MAIRLLSSESISGSLTVSGTLGLSGTTAQYVRGDGAFTTLPLIPSDNVTGTGTAGRVAYWTSASNISSDGAFRFDGTNVAIGGAIVASRKLAIYNTNADNELEFIGADYTNIYSNTDSTMAVEVIGDGALRLATKGGNLTIVTGGSSTFSGNVQAPSVLATGFMEIRSDTAALYFENAANNHYYRFQRSSNDLNIDYYNGSTTTLYALIDSAGSFWATRLYAGSGNGYRRTYLQPGGARITSSSDNSTTLDISVTDTKTEIYSNYYSGGNNNDICIGTYPPSQNQLYLKNNGYVGIGTDLPTKKLHLKSAVNNGSDILQETDASRIILLEQKNATIHWQLGTFGTTGGGVNNRYSIKNATTGVENFVINPTNGNVGIGTTTPQGKLDSVAPVADLTDFGRATGSALNIRIGNVIGYLGQINFCNDAAPAFGYGSIGMVMTSGSGVGLGDMVFGTKSSGSAVVSTERLRINSSGDISQPVALGAKIHSVAGNVAYPTYGFNGITGRGMMMSSNSQLNIVQGGGNQIKLMSTINTAYVSDGLWGTNATPNIIKSGSGLGMYFGYQDNGSGLYAAAYGFLTKSVDGLGNTSQREIIQIKDNDSGQINFTITNLGAVTARGTITANGSPSDIRLKENIKPINSALSKIKKIQGVSFDWKPSDSIVDTKEDYGFIAQEVQKSLPEIIKEDAIGMLSMRYNSVIPILVESVKELEKVVNDLKKEIIELKKN